jgi:hypothetical protein
MHVTNGAKDAKMHVRILTVGQLTDAVGEAQMGRAETHLAAFAVAVAFLLAGANGAVAAADTPDSTGGEKSSTTASDSGPGAGGGPTGNTTDHNETGTPNNTGGGGGGEADTRTFGAEADKSAEDEGGGTNETAPTAPGDDEVKKPVDHESPKSDYSDGKTISRIPLRPQAPPALDLLPSVPEAPPPIIEAPPPVVEAPPPPADLPPAVPPAPAAPVDPGVVDAVAGEAEHHPSSNESPVLNMPFIATPGVFAPPHILGASVAPRWAATSVAAGPAPRWGSGRGSAPSLRRVRASTDGPALRELSLTNSGLATRMGTPYRTATNESVRRPISEMAAGALPGVAGIVLMTASGICLGYRQAKTSQLLRTEGADRFMN